MTDTIKDLVIGSPYSILRRLVGVPLGQKLLSGTLDIRRKETDDTALITADIDENIQSTGQVTNNGALDGAATFNFILEDAVTDTLSDKLAYHYKIWLTTDYAGTFVYEEGTIEPILERTDLGSALATNAVASSHLLTERTRKLIDEYLDTIIHDFRQLRVWDEHARRDPNDPKRLWLTYQNWNSRFYPQVFDGGNNPITADKLQIDFKHGTLVVTTDDGNQDYFVTYEMNLFPADQLLALLQLTLMEINSTAEQGTHLTYYPDIDHSPPFWDGPLVYGTVAKAFRRLQTDGTLWKNFLIWQDGNNGQTIASEASSYYQAQFDDLRKSLKRGQYLAKPGLLYQFFTAKGFGGSGLPYTGRFTAMMQNTRISVY